MKLCDTEPRIRNLTNTFIREIQITEYVAEFIGYFNGVPEPLGPQ